MELNEKITLWKYLDKNYLVVDGVFLFKAWQTQETGGKLSQSLSLIFSFEEEDCLDALKHWGYSNGMSFKEWENSFGFKPLKYTYTPEMALDLSAQYGIDIEETLTRMLVDELTKEIDNDILKKIRYLNSFDGLTQVMKCIGYGTEDVIDNYTFRPLRRFVPITYEEKIEARRDSPYWQDYITNL